MNRQARVRADFPLLGSLARPGWAGAVVHVWVELWEQSAWPVPAACPYNPIAPAVDLVTHVNQVTIGAIRLAELARASLDVEADGEVVIASGLLHDASKLVEYEPGPGGGARKSTYGRAHVHAALAAERAAQAGLPPAVVDIVRNHTPASPEVPASVEALCVYYSDMCAADLARLQGGVELIVARHKLPAG